MWPKSVGKSVVAPAIVVSGTWRVSASYFFLHESRRYVCRFCTSHLDRVEKELSYRLHFNSKKEAPNNKQHREFMQTSRMTCSNLSDLPLYRSRVLASHQAP